MDFETERYSRPPQHQAEIPTSLVILSVSRRIGLIASTKSPIRTPMIPETNSTIDSIIYISILIGPRYSSDSGSIKSSVNSQESESGVFCPAVHC